jgi:hypothetical protein
MMDSEIPVVGLLTLAQIVGVVIKNSRRAGFALGRVWDGWGGLKSDLRLLI